MRIIVCVKQVPDDNEVRIDPVTNTLVRDCAAVTNPFDAYALREAVRLKARCGAEVAVLSMGVPSAEVQLRDCIARGADRALLLSDRAFAGADTLATSYALSLGVQKLGGAALILCGKMAVDGDTAQIGPELAAQLGLPCVTRVTEIGELSGDSVTVTRLSDGVREQLRVRLPALLTVEKDPETPPLPSLAGVLRGAAAELSVCGCAALGADPARCGLAGSPTQVRRSYTPPRRRAAAELAPEQAAETILALAKEALR